MHLPSTLGNFIIFSILNFLFLYQSDLHIQQIIYCNWEKYIHVWMNGYKKKQRYLLQKTTFHCIIFAQAKIIKLGTKIVPSAHMHIPRKEIWVQNFLVLNGTILTCKTFVHSIFAFDVYLWSLSYKLGQWDSYIYRLFHDF